eukprot:jgi/Undpi1/12721/HiC_scaffold_6.g02389.m1
MEVQVAFWKGDERSRTLEAAINGDVVGEFDSYSGSTFNVLGIEGVGVDTLSLKYADIADNGWISLIEDLVAIRDYALVWEVMAASSSSGQLGRRFSAVTGGIGSNYELGKAGHV